MVILNCTGPQSAGNLIPATSPLTLICGAAGVDAQPMAIDIRSKPEPKTAHILICRSSVPFPVRRCGKTSDNLELLHWRNVIATSSAVRILARRVVVRVSDGDSYPTRRRNRVAPDRLRMTAGWIGSRNGAGVELELPKDLSVLECVVGQERLSAPISVHPSDIPSLSNSRPLHPVDRGTRRVSVVRNCVVLLVLNKCAESAAARVANFDDAVVAAGAGALFSQHDPITVGVPDCPRYSPSRCVEQLIFLGLLIEDTNFCWLGGTRRCSRVKHEFAVPA